mgnify:CR=1 FL=1|jgi:hypothetical protein
MSLFLQTGASSQLAAQTNQVDAHASRTTATQPINSASNLQDAEAHSRGCDCLPSVLVFNSRTSKRRFTFSAAQPVTAVAFRSRKSNGLVVGTFGGMLHFFSFSPSIPDVVHQLKDDINCIALSEDGVRLVVGGKVPSPVDPRSMQKCRA